MNTLMEVEKKQMRILVVDDEEIVRDMLWLYADVLPCKTITMSVGIVSYPKDALLKEELISKADEAMYHAKKTGKNKVCYYDKNKIVDYNEERAG